VVSISCLLLVLVGLAAVIAVAVFLAVELNRRPAGKSPLEREHRAVALPPSPQPAAAPIAGGCPVCGARLAGDSPQGLCPQCLLQCALSASNQPSDSSDPAGTAAYQGPSTAPAVADLASLFPQLEILELIGQGGMGAVYKARQTKLDRLVAVKILPQEWGKDPAFAERFAREARALARLSHAHIVAVHDFGETGGLYYLVMEYVDGANLRHVLQSGRLQPQQALQIVPQVCAALQYAHEEGIVHRDIKPENILLDKRGQVKIADFGLAKLVRGSGLQYTLTGSRQVMGTIDYMAPEQRTTPQEVDHRADIYSLGVVLYEMLTGELPLGRFAAPSHKAAVDGRLDEVVFRALEREPGRRYQRISEVKADVESIAHGTPATAMPAQTGRQGQDDLAAEMAQLRVEAPAGGLVATAIVFVLQAFVIAVIVISTTHPRDLEKVLPIFFLAGFAVLAVAATMIGGALKMAKLQSYEIVMVTVILAMLPFSFHFLIGLPVGIWALWVLRQPDVKAAFAMNLRKSAMDLRRSRGGVKQFGAGAARQANRKPTGFLYGMVKSAVGGMLTLIVHRPTAASTAEMEGAGQVDEERESVRGAVTPVHQAKNTDVVMARRLGRGLSWPMVLMAVAMVFVFGVAWLVSHGEPRVMDIGARIFPQSKEPPLAFWRGNPRRLSLYGDQEEQIKELLCLADQQYLEIEAQHSRREGDAFVGYKTQVSAFANELKTLEDRVWLQLGQVLQNFQLTKAKQLLAVRGSLFPLGKEAVVIEITQRDNQFSWRLTTKDTPDVGTWSSGPELPPQYARFWPGPSGDVAAHTKAIDN
jgi:tRNA A-37 threonylcarbamoyl transferase component Bud32